jgi:hypothetical protein
MAEGYAKRTREGPAVAISLTLSTDFGSHARLNGPQKASYTTSYRRQMIIEGRGRYSATTSVPPYASVGDVQGEGALMSDPPLGHRRPLPRILLPPSKGGCFVVNDTKPEYDIDKMNNGLYLFIEGHGGRGDNATGLEVVFVIAGRNVGAGAKRRT